jgi:predicted heme/steroid binding protein
MQQFTPDELKQFDGQDGRPAYVAYGGKVYDVSQSGLWQSGAHFEHIAGKDLNQEFKNAPHGEEVFQQVQLVGELKV